MGLLRAACQCDWRQWHAQYKYREMYREYTKRNDYCMRSKKPIRIHEISTRLICLTQGDIFSHLLLAHFQLHFSCSVDFWVDLNQNDGYYTPFVAASLYISWSVSNIAEHKQQAHTLILFFYSVFNWCSRKVYKSFIWFVSAFIVSHWTRSLSLLLSLSSHLSAFGTYLFWCDVHNTSCINVYGSNALHSTRRYRSFTSCRSLIALLLCSLLLFFRLCLPRTAAVRQPFHQPS